MTQSVQHDYSRLLIRFQAARHAWKRTAVFTGSAVVVIEAIGALTLAALADILFAPSQAGRIAILVAALITVAFFAMGHVIRPLFRTITNRQLALYLEERSPEFEGALIGAAEFGPDVALRGRQAEIVDLILREAVHRAEEFDLRKAVDFSRFRKYGLVAAGLVGLYLAAGLLLPNLGTRLVTPWKLTPEEEAARTTVALKAQPIAFTLSRGDAEILRGSTFELEAVLSRQAADPVLFHFRSLGLRGSDSSWKLLAMKELEKLNTFQAALADVNEDCEFFVSSGPYKSDPHRVAVYDPLVVKGFEIAAKYPAYMKLPDRIENGETADIKAPVGSTVTMKILTNRPLKSGDLLWEKGEPSHGTVDSAEKTALAVSFPVQESTTFRYRLSDVSRQLAESPVPASVTAVIDQPPAVKLLKPGPAVSGNPLSEVPFLAEVSDDFGLGGGELVVARIVDDKVQEERFPLAFDSDLARSAVTSGTASAVLALENFGRKIMPGEVLTCYLEIRDRKGQATASDLSLVSVGPFSVWTFHSAPHPGTLHALYYLEPVLTATWELHRNKRTLATKEFDKQAEYIADTMLDPETKELLPYINLHHLSGANLEHGTKGLELAQKAHDDLVRHDTAMALMHLQFALAEFEAAGYKETMNQHDAFAEPEQAATTNFHKEMRRLTALAEKLAPPASESKEGTHGEGTSAADAAGAEALSKEQAKVVQQIKEAMAQPQANSRAQRESLTGKESTLGEKTRTLAESVKTNGNGDQEKIGAANDLAGAARTLHEADAAINANNLSQALAQAEAAYQQLGAASGKLNANSQERVSQLLADAAALSMDLHRKQEGLLKQTRAAPKEDEARQLGQQQVQLVGGLHNLQEILVSLEKVEASGALKPETAKHVEEAAQIIKHSRLEQKITNAAVELAAANAAGAVLNQTKALESLSKIRDELFTANSARAADLAAALLLAKTQAKVLEGKLAQMGAKPQAKAGDQLGAKPGDQHEPKPGDQPGTKPGDQPGARPGAKPSDQPGAKPGNSHESKPGDQHESKPGDQPGAKSGDQPGSKPGDQAGAGRNELAEAAADEAKRLADQLGARDLVKDDKDFARDVREIQGLVEDRDKLATELKNTSSTPERLAALAQRVSDRLETAYEATLAVKRLFAAQREECPPQYRQLVNRYFEALSKQEK